MRLSMELFISQARLGDVAAMPGVIATLADRLRSGGLDEQESAFLADALQRISEVYAELAQSPPKRGNAALNKAAREIANTLLLVRPPGRTTKSEAFDLAYLRASRVSMYKSAGLSTQAAIAKVTELERSSEQNTSQVSKAYYALKDVTDDHDILLAQTQEAWLRERIQKHFDKGTSIERIAAFYGCSCELIERLNST